MVVLQPYKRYPPGCKEQLKLACSKTYCINRVVVAIHEPDCVPAQFGFVTIDESSAPKLCINFTYPKKGPKKKRDLNDVKKYGVYRNGWYSRSALRGQVFEDWELQPWMEGWVENQEEGRSEHVSRNHAEQPEDSPVGDNFREQLNKRPIEESCDSTTTSESLQLLGLEDRIWRLENILNEIKRAKLCGTCGGNLEM